MGIGTELWFSLLRGTRKSQSRDQTSAAKFNKADLVTLRLQLMEAQRLLLKAGVMLRRIRRELGD